jgi:hypothetical protein
MENLYSEGAFIMARKNQSSKLIIDRYYKRIYYCFIVDDPSHKLLAYFERELMPFAGIQK